jgi:3-deoxy-D-manno-octulosonate 8-phosphate phosphatase (KDO 8-P phosphatase)
MDTATRLALPIKLLLMDVDGVLTNGHIIYGNNGEEFKAFNIKDGLGIKLLREQGIETGIITGRQSSLVERRASELGIATVIQGREDKLVAVREVADAQQLDLQEIAYIGDDLPDLPAITHSGLGMSVNDGHTRVKQAADWVSSCNGGEGAVREACEFILASQDLLENSLQKYLL